MFTTTAERSEIRNRLSELMKSCPIGETVSLESILEISGLPIDKTRPILYSVMTKLNRSTGIVFSSVFGVGYQRLPTAGIPAIGGQARLAISRKSRRTRKTIVNALGRANDVDPSTRRRLHSEVGALGLVELAASERSLKKITATIDPEAKPPTPTDIAKTLMSSLRGK